MKKIHLIAGARPNFMKIAPLFHELKKTTEYKPVIIHTGQHFDVNMSDAFLSDLKLDPDFNLGVGSGSHAEQTGRIMVEYEKICVSEKPDLVVVVGDVNSTVACTLAAVKLGNKVAHLEAGLRSYDRSMPEEINRIVTDTLSDLLWTPSTDADENLLKEGISSSKIHRVGNIMIDSLEMLRPFVSKLQKCQELNLSPKCYAVVTLHRPSNVDDGETLNTICTTLKNISNLIPLLIPFHPRTRKKLAEVGIDDKYWNKTNIRITDPLSYKEFMSVLFDSKLVITDSGGLQEETTYLGIPCLTLRPNTERPITITHGTNQLVTLQTLFESTIKILEGVNKDQITSTKTPLIPLWDGKTATRVVLSIRNFFT